MRDQEENRSLSVSGESHKPRNAQTWALTAPSDTLMRELWIRMSAMYPHKWSSACAETFGESGPTGHTWRAGLAGITGQMMADGFRGCLTRTDPWPPTLPEFRAMCLPAPVDHSKDWRSDKPDQRKMPSAERLAWHKANQSWIRAGHELPVPGLIEPPAPVCRA